MTNTTVDQMLDQGVALLQSGQSDKAEEIFRSVIAISPHLGEAYQLLGALKLSQDDFETAENALTKAIELDDKDAQAYFNLAAVYMKTDRLAEALAPARMATSIAPNAAMTWTQQAIAEDVNGHTDAALVAIEKAITFGGGDAALLLRRVGLFIKSCQHDAAIKQLVALFQHSLSQVHLQKAIRFAKQCHEMSLAYQYAQKYVQAFPGVSQAWRLLSEAAMDIGDVQTAQQSFVRILELEGRSADNLLAYARLCLSAQKFKIAEEVIREAFAVGKAGREAYFALARLKTFLGKLEEAAQACDQAIEADPDYSPAYAQLVNIRRGHISDEIFDQMQSLWQKTSDNQGENQASLAYALGDILDKRKFYKDAFAYYSEANRIKKSLYERQNAAFDPSDHDRMITLLKSEAWALDQDLQFPSLGFRPVFIVGLPRSGTTVTEAILAAHSQVHGVGEGLIGPAVFQNYMSSLKMGASGSLVDYARRNGANLRQAFARSYEERSGKTIVVDKMPVNFLAVGLLVHIFPEARFVYTKRSLLETGFSIYRHAFPKSYNFAVDQTHIGHYALSCDHLMAHWQSCFEQSGRKECLFVMNHETLLGDSEGTIDSLLEAVGLAFETDCLEFHKQERPVATFSSVQVRSSIEEVRLGKATPYDEYLGPMKSALGI